MTTRSAAAIASAQPQQIHNHVHVHGLSTEDVVAVIARQHQPAAIEAPLHLMDQPDRASHVHGARVVTAGARPIVIHDPTRSVAGHSTQPGQRECWCGPITIPAG